MENKQYIMDDNGNLFELPDDFYLNEFKGKDTVPIVNKETHFENIWVARVYSPVYTGRQDHKNIASIDYNDYYEEEFDHEPSEKELMKMIIISGFGKTGACVEIEQYKRFSWW